MLYCKSHLGHICKKILQYFVAFSFCLTLQSGGEHTNEAKMVYKCKSCLGHTC